MVSKPDCMGDRRGSFYFVVGSLAEGWRKKECLIALRWIYKKPGIYPVFIFIMEIVKHKWGISTTKGIRHFTVILPDILSWYGLCFFIVVKR